MVSCPETESMRSNNLAEVIQPLKCVLDITIRPAGDANGESLEVQLRHALNGRIQHVDTKCVRAGGEPQRIHADRAAVRGLVHQDVIPHILEANLVDGRITEGLGVSQVDVLCASRARCSKARN
jgi:hypothetical protein